MLKFVEKSDDDDDEAESRRQPLKIVAVQRGFLKKL